MLKSLRFLPVFLIATAAFAQNVKPDTKPDADAQHIIQASVVNVRGMQFPKRPALTMARDVSCCQPGDTRNINGVAKIDLSTPDGLSKKKYVPESGYTEAIYSPPLSCWVISSYNRHVTDANVPYEAMDDAQPAGFHYLTHQQFTSTLQEMKNYVAHLNILDKYKGDLDAKLESFVKSYGDYENEIQNSNSEVRHRARVQGRGMFNGSSWYHAEINTTEICCPPEIRDQNALRQTLKSWVDDTASKLPHVGHPHSRPPLPLPPPMQ